MEKRKATKEEQDASLGAGGDDDKKKGGKGPGKGPGKGKGKEEDGKDKDGKKGKGKDDRDDADETKGRMGMKKRAKLKRKNDKVNEGPTHIDDEPADGPDAYILIQHCCSEAFLQAAAKLNFGFDIAVKLKCQYREGPKKLKKKRKEQEVIAEEAAAKAAKEEENGEGKGSDEEGGGKEEILYSFSSVQPCGEFWASLDDIITSPSHKGLYKDMVYLTHTPDKLDGSPKEPNTFYTTIAQSVYEVVRQKKIFNVFLNNLKIMTFPNTKEITSGDLGIYNAIIKDIPEESLSVPVILDALLQQIDLTLNQNSGEDDEQKRLFQRTCEFLGRVDEGLASCFRLQSSFVKGFDQVPISRMSIESADGCRTRTPMKIHRYGDDISRRTLAHSEDVSYLVGESEDRIFRSKPLLRANNIGMPSRPSKSLKERIVLKEAIEQLFEAESANVDRTLIQFKFEDMLNKRLSGYEETPVHSRSTSARTQTAEGNSSDEADHDVAQGDETKMLKEPSLSKLVLSDSSLYKNSNRTIEGGETGSMEENSESLQENTLCDILQDKIDMPRNWNFADRTYAEYFNKRQLYQVISKALSSRHELYSSYYEEDDILLVAIHNPATLTEYDASNAICTNEQITEEAVNIITPVGFRDFYDHVLRNNPFAYPLEPPATLPESEMEKLLKEKMEAMNTTSTANSDEEKGGKEEMKKEESKQSAKKSAKEKEAEKEKEKKPLSKKEKSLKKGEENMSSVNNVAEETHELDVASMRQALEEEYVNNQKCLAYDIGSGVLRYHFDEHYFYDLNGVILKSLKTKPTSKSSFCQFSLTYNDDFVNAYMFNDPELKGKQPGCNDSVSAVFGNGVCSSIEFNSCRSGIGDDDKMDYSFRSVALSTEEGLKIVCRDNSTVEQMFLAGNKRKLAKHREKVLEIANLEKSRQYFKSGIVMKHFHSGDTELLFPSGKRALFRSEKAEWLCIDIDGSQMIIDEEGEISYNSPMKVYATHDPSSDDYVVFREDMTKTVVKKNGMSLCEHYDGTLITAWQEEGNEDDSLKPSNNMSVSEVSVEDSSDNNTPSHEVEHRIEEELKTDVITQTNVEDEQRDENVKNRVESNATKDCPTQSENEAEKERMTKDKSSNPDMKDSEQDLKCENSFTASCIEEVLSRLKKNSHVCQYMFECNGYVDTNISCKDGLVTLDFNGTFYVRYDPQVTFSIKECGISELRASSTGEVRYRIADESSVESLNCDDMTLKEGTYIFNLPDSSCSTRNRDGVNCLAGFTHRARSSVQAVESCYYPDDEITANEANATLPEKLSRRGNGGP